MWNYLPKLLYDGSTGNGEGNSSHSSNGQRYSHSKLGGAKILQEPEEVGFKESPNASTNKEDNQEHEDVRFDYKLPKILEYNNGYGMAWCKFIMISITLNTFLAGFLKLRFSLRMRAAEMSLMTKKM